MFIIKSKSLYKNFVFFSTELGDGGKEIFYIISM